MDNKDLLGKGIKEIMIDETKNITLSQQSIDKIIKSREITWKDKLNKFLDKEIEIPLAPAIVGFAALFVISILPMDLLKNQEIKVINIGSSQVFLREKEVSKR
ncbi:hypothetical protein [Tissierella sp. Yu-01]|uniref:hypothetical protein n=1 Tax=Tissierella sp. Yu-01 TaxID=3035694 RepID=UPI00240E654B|nr:hypothetical protein [Tissierella sp. Yu-01]WFA08909.1 hypothetical protein P3962_14465 [Tissierella sp. Yu-01]